MAVSRPGGSTGRNLWLVVTGGFAALVVVGAASLWLVTRSATYAEDAARAVQNRTTINAVLTIASDAETGQRGFLLTRDERYLFPYNGAIQRQAEVVKALHEIGISSDIHRAEVTGLELALKTKMDELAETIALQRAGDTAGAMALVETDRGRDAMRTIRRLVGEMTRREDALTADRVTSARRSGSWLLAVTVLSLIMIAVLAAVANVLTRRQTQALRDASEQLREANTGLEAAVAERTAELTSANQEIQRFAYIVSHDLRAPLVNVMGFTSELDAARASVRRQLDAIAERAPELLQQDAKLAAEEDLPEAIGFIRASTTKMDRLINAILKLSREGSRVITPERIAVDEVVSQIAATLQTQLTTADAEILFEGELPALVTDRMTLEQIFQNIIENAVKYLDRSRPGRVVVTGRRMGLYVEYSIADNGRGIDPKDHERVFELFRRAGAQDQPGEGLGLAFVRASVRRLGGAIRLTSEAGAGSTFHLVFPAVLTTKQTEARAA